MSNVESFPAIVSVTEFMRRLLTVPENQGFVGQLGPGLELNPVEDCATEGHHVAPLTIADLRDYVAFNETIQLFKLLVTYVFMSAGEGERHAIADRIIQQLGIATTLTGESAPYWSSLPEEFLPTYLNLGEPTACFHMGVMERFLKGPARNKFAGKALKLIGEFVSEHDACPAGCCGRTGCRPCLIPGYSMEGDGSSDDHD